jgi:hypothetical protein
MIEILGMKVMSSNRRTEHPKKQEDVSRRKEF